MSKIVLTMIVKNEGPVIERVLHSCFNIIDSYCIVDTGSTDNTKELIKNFFDSKGISGKIIDFEFTNFGECRNKTIEHGKELGEYAFWIDADEQLIISQDFDKEKFCDFLTEQKPDQLLVNCKYDEIHYTRTQFFNLNSEYYWYGPVHEVLTTKKANIKSIIFQHGHVLVQSDGNSWQTNNLSEKYENHAHILLEYQNQNNWKDSRWTFYLAQSYKDAANILLQKNPKDTHGLELAKKSIKYYSQRINDNTGFFEEIYYSQLMLSRMSYFSNTDDFVISQLMKCEEFNTQNRIEHLFNICSFLQSNKMHKTALIFLEKAINYIRQGNLSSLFIEQYIYKYAIYDMYAISLFYTESYEESLKYFKYALQQANGNCTDSEFKRIENNIKSVEVICREKGVYIKQGKIRI